MPISIRKAELRDVPAIARIHVAAWERAYRGVLPDEAIEVRTVELRERVWTETLSDPPPRDVMLVAEQDGEVHGFATGVPSFYEDKDPQRVLNFNLMYLDPEQEGKGLAAALYEALLHAAKDLGYEELDGQIIVENTLSWHFLVEQRGWRPDGHERVKEGLVERRVGGTLDDLFAALRPSGQPG